MIILILAAMLTISSNSNLLASTEKDNSKEMQVSSKKLYKCTKDSDCVMTKDHCGGPTAINKKYRKEYEDYSENIRQVILCQKYAPANWPEDPKDISAKCINFKCKAVLEE